MRRSQRAKRTKLRTREVELGLLVRNMQLDRAEGSFDEEGRRGEFTFSSELPVERYFGLEILDHDPRSVRLGRINDGGAWLKDHRRDQQIGVIEEARIDAQRRKGIARGRFSRGELGEQERVDVVDRIRRNVSVGYIVHEMRLEASGEGGDVYRVTDWEPVEVSNVSIPSDGTVGHGRELEAELPGLAERCREFRHHRTRLIYPRHDERSSTMRRIQVERLEDGAVVFIDERQFDESLHRKVETPSPAPNSQPAGSGARTSGAEDDAAAAVESARRAEAKRIEEIRALGAKYHADANRVGEAIANGTSFADFRWELFETGHSPSGEPARSEYPTLEEPAGRIGLSRKESRSYSLMRAIRAHVEKDWSEAEFERECSQAVEDRMDERRPPRGFYVPRELLDVPLAETRSEADRIAQLVREVSTTTQGGGSLVATDLLAASFIEVLRNRSVLMRMGATFLPGLTGNVDVPRQSAAGSATWGGEGSAALDADLGLDTVQLRPKTLSGKSKLTRRLLLQSSPAIEGLVRVDLATAISLGIDKAGVQGSGVGDVPEGILNTAGVAVVPLGSPDGGSPTWANTVKLVSSVKKANAYVGALGFVMSSDAWGTMMSTPREAGDSRMILDDNGDRLLGRAVLSSEQVPSDLVKGASGSTLSAVIFGNWADELVGEWGVLDLFPDPYTSGDEGAVILRAFQDADVAVRHEESFSIHNDMVTV